MKSGEIILTVFLAVVCIAFFIQWGVNHIMGALRELAARIDTISEKIDVLQEKLDSIESKQDEMTL